jgi:hypothetical protein
VTSRFVRISLTVATALLVAAGSVGCTTFENQRVAAVGDRALSQDDLAAILESELMPVVFEAPAPIGGTVDGDTARSIVSIWITLAALFDAGLIDDAQVQEVTTGISTDPQFATAWGESPAVMQDLIAWYTVVGNALASGELEREAAIAAIQGAAVTVDSFYGVWDSEQLAIVALG